MAHATAQFFWSLPPGALGRGQKVKYHLISITKSILNQTLCVFSKMKDIKHIRRDFQGLGLGGAGGSKILFSEHGHVAIQIKGDEQ